MEEYKEQARRIEEKRKQSAEGNLANFQFVDAINNLMYEKYNTNCNLFTLKDKANVRRMIQSAMKNTEKGLKESKLLQEIHEDLKNEGEDVKQLLQESRAIEAQIQELVERLEQARAGRQEHEKRRGQLLGELEDLKLALAETTRHKEDKETSFKAKCEETLKILARARDEQAKQLEALEVQLEMKKIKHSLHLDSLTQHESIDLVKLQNELKAIEMKTEQLKFASKQYLREKEKEYEAVKLEWNEMLDRRNRLLGILESEKESAKEKSTKVRRLRELIGHAEQQEKIYTYDVECELRNKKYGVAERSGAKTEATQDDDMDTIKEEDKESSRSSPEDRFQLVVGEASQKLLKMQQVVVKLFEIHMKKKELEKKSKQGSSQPDLNESKEILSLRSQAEKLMTELSKKEDQ